MKKVVLLSIVAVYVPLISSCDRIFGRGGDDDEVLPATETALEGVDIHSLEDSACEQSGAVESTTKAYTWIWNGTESVKTQVDLAGSSGTDGEFMTAGVLGALRDLEAVYECEVVGGEGVCPESGTVKSNGTVMKLCRSDLSYSREALESQLLTTHYFVEKSKSLYEALPSAKSGLVKAILFIQPRVIKNYKKEDGTYARLMMTDNASFSFAKTEDGEEYGVFSSYPTSKKYYSQTPVHLWEVPFVMAHEYGHNIFEHHVGSVANSVGLRLIAGDGFKKSIMRTNMTELGSGLKTKTPLNIFSNLLEAETPAEKALGGINELYADLFSFYVNEGKSDLLKGVACLETSRDPKSDKTAAGTEKKWTTTVDDIFTGKTSASTSEDCSEPLYDDIHDVASVLGYVAAHLIDSSMPSATYKDKLNLLVQFADGIASHVSSSGTAVRVDSLFKVLVALVKQNRTTGSTATTAICQELAAQIPALTGSVSACL